MLFILIGKKSSMIVEVLCSLVLFVNKRKGFFGLLVLLLLNTKTISNREYIKIQIVQSISNHPKIPFHPTGRQISLKGMKHFK